MSWIFEKKKKVFHAPRELQDWLELLLALTGCDREGRGNLRILVEKDRVTLTALGIDGLGAMVRAFSPQVYEYIYGQNGIDGGCEMTFGQLEGWPAAKDLLPAHARIAEHREDRYIRVEFDPLPWDGAFAAITRFQDICDRYHE